MDDLDKYIKEQMKDKEFKREYNKEKKRKRYMVSFRLPSDQALFLKEYAKEQGISVSELVRRILREKLGLDKEEEK